MVTAFLLSGWPILYVSQFGSDSNPGTEKAPFATLERLQQKLKEHPQGATKQGLEVKITGTIRLKKPIEFGPEVSRVIFTGGGTISGGVQLKNWKPTEFNGHKVWSTAVPAGLEFKELWVGKSGERAVRPTLPKTGFSQLAGFVSEADEKGPWDKGQDAAVFQPGALKSSWRNLSDVELVAHHLWVTSRLPIASIDESTRIVRFGKKSVFKLSNDYQGGGSAYVLENVAEALDSPGEWYHDRPSRTLYYMPRPGEKIQGFVAEAPAIPFLLSVKGASGVGFHNLKFNHSEWNYPADSSGDGQAAFNVPGAIQLIDCERAAISNCTISGVGSYVIGISGSSKGCQVSRCVLKDLGAGGVKLGDNTEHTIVSDNQIESGGRLHAAGEGVWVGLSGDNEVIHNTIRDFYYTGISVGWDWGFKDTAAKNNLIAYNDISEIGQAHLSDMGGIYVLGKQPGSRIENNRIRNVYARGYGGWGIYLDEGSTGWTVEKNVVMNTKTGGFHIHYGGNNVIRNNIFAYAKQDGQLIRSRDDQQGPITFERNLVIAGPKDAPLVVNSWLKRDVKMIGNFYAVPKVPLPFGDDGSGRFVVAVLDKDGNLVGNSPLYKLGFEKIDLRLVGPRHSIDR